jgi:hypothetical protein
LLAVNEHPNNNVCCFHRRRFINKQQYAGSIWNARGILALQGTGRSICLGFCPLESIDSCVSTRTLDKWDIFGSRGCESSDPVLSLTCPGFLWVAFVKACYGAWLLPVQSQRFFLPISPMWCGLIEVEDTGNTIALRRISVGDGFQLRLPHHLVVYETLLSRFFFWSTDN